jgi:serine/threonine-protein kinase
MLEEEARISKLLDHPNIVRCYDSGIIDNTPFIAFELIEGLELNRWAATKAPRPLPLSMAIDVAIEVAKALDYAHRRTGRDGQALELVHRDVSPQNILIASDGAVKLLDFGISRFKERQHETQTGLVKGKLIYMAPEQIDGHIVDQRTDLYQLALVMAELIAGKRLAVPKPFWIPAHVRDLRPVLEQHFGAGGGFSEKLLELLVAMTSYDASKRPATASQVVRELRAIRAGVST